MFARAPHSLAFLLLIPLSGTAAAQAWPSERAEGETPRDLEAPVFWQKANDDAMQTFLGIRHDADAGTVVGLSLRPPGYPAFLLEVEVVPHGYGPLEDDKELPTQSSLLAPESQSLRSVHKLSLRYRF